MQKAIDNTPVGGEHGALPAMAPDTRMFLLGAFTILASDGTNVTPRGQKAKALLALVATAEYRGRSRTWLCDKLWSDKPSAQALASLRQTLREIRRSMGAVADTMLEISRFEIRLRLEHVCVDILTLRDNLERGAEWQHLLPAGAAFLEGIDVRDAEFEEWLVAERRHWDEFAEQNLGARLSDAATATHASAPGDFPAIRVALMTPDIRGASDVADYAAALAMDLISQQIAETTVIEVLDLRAAILGGEAADSSAFGLGVHVRVNNVVDELNLTISILQAETRRLEWTMNLTLPPDPARFPGEPMLLRAVNLVWIQLTELLAQRLSPDDRRPEAEAVRALSTAFDPRVAGREGAIRQMRAAMEVLPQPQLRAWLAFLLTCAVSEDDEGADLGRRAEIEALVREALLQDGANALTLTLCAHALSEGLGQSGDAGDRFADALGLNSKRALTWALFAALHSRIGMPGPGLKCGIWAMQIAGPGAMSVLIDRVCCINAAAIGDHAAALLHGRRVLASSPSDTRVGAIIAEIAGAGHQRDEAAE